MHNKMILFCLIAVVNLCGCHKESPTEPGEVTAGTNLPDYFPLQVGNKWFYTYSTNHTDGGGNYDGTRAALKWEVIGKVNYGYRTDYKIQKTFSHYFAIVGSNDTTYYPSVSGVFTAVHYGNDSLVITDTSRVVADYSFDPFSRHNDPSLVGDTLSVFYKDAYKADGRASIKRGVGCISAFRGGPTSSFGWYSTILVLDSSKLGQ